MRNVLLLAAAVMACAPAADDATTGSTVSESAPIQLRYARRYAGCDACPRRWVAVIEVHGHYFKEKVSAVYRGPGGSWIERQGKILRPLDADRTLWFVDEIEAGDDLELAGHYLGIFSGGTAVSYWDNNHDANYRGSPGSAPLGNRIDVAVTGLQVDGEALSVDLLVRNRTYDKDVGIVYTTDGWATSQYASADYMEGGQSGGETWRATTSVAAGATEVELAAFAEQAGQESWDNDFDLNFGCRRSPSGSWSCTARAAVACGTSGCMPYPDLD